MNPLEAIIDIETATAIVRDHIDSKLSILAIDPLHGGMVNQVQQWRTSGSPTSIVAKINPTPNEQSLLTEFDSLKWYCSNTSFPVPRPYACISGHKRFAGTCLLMEKAPGRNLSQARLTSRGLAHFEINLAHILADLHRHKRSRYGSALKPNEGTTRWLDIFQPQIKTNFEKAKDRLTPPSLDTITAMLKSLEEWLPESNQPTLIHGDLWATNIMLDDTDPDKPRITAFLDTHARFAEVEYELAYLRVFNTAGNAFFTEYASRQPLRQGFDRRCRIYWLNTMLLHVWMFGDSYVPAGEKLAREIAFLA